MTDYKKRSVSTHRTDGSREATEHVIIGFQAGDPTDSYALSLLEAKRILSAIEKTRENCPTGDATRDSPATSRTARETGGEATGNIRILGDSTKGNGKKREVWGYCPDGTSFNATKWVADSYWTVGARRIVQESGLNLDSAVRVACK